MSHHNVLVMAGAVFSLAMLSAVANAGFVPPTTGLQAWFDSTVGVTTDDSGVKKWSDQSGHGYDASRVSAGFSPTVGSATVGVNTVPVVNFNCTAGNSSGVGDNGGYLAMPSISGASAWTGFNVVIVSETTHHLSGDALFSTGGGSVGGGSPGVRWNFSTDNTGGNGGLGWVGPTNAIGLGTWTGTDNQFNYTSWSYDKSNWKVTNLLDGSTLSTVADTSFFTAGFDGRIGAEYGGGAHIFYPFSGNMAEILVYDHALTSSEVSGLQTYVNNRYFTTAQTPEPSTCVMTMLGAIGLMAYAWRKHR
jgi:hypothetical protein